MGGFCNANTQYAPRRASGAARPQAVVIVERVPQQRAESIYFEFRLVKHRLSAFSLTSGSIFSPFSTLTSRVKVSKTSGWTAYVELCI